MANPNPSNTHHHNMDRSRNKWLLWALIAVAALAVAWAIAQSRNNDAVGQGAMMNQTASTASGRTNPAIAADATPTQGVTSASSTVPMDATDRVPPTVTGDEAGIDSTINPTLNDVQPTNGVSTGATTEDPVTQ